MRLSNATLDQLPADVARPTYDRSAVTPGIVHFGVGGFHRAHQARYLDELMNRGKNLDWGIIGMGVMPGDVRMRDALKPQDGLYTLTEKSPDGSENARVIGSIIDYVFAPDDPAHAVSVLADASIHIVSLTVTEGGYNFDHVTGEFQLDNPQVAADIEAIKKHDFSGLVTFFGLITAAIITRKEKGITPFTVMSCDNIQGNGDVASKMFLSFTKAIDPELSSWVEENIPFPNSMVDRITPETTDQDREDIKEKHGYEDAWPVVCEDFTQWVLQEKFAQGRPDYDEVGVQVVDDVVPYELMKLRLLNASHQGLCYFGYLAGYRLVHDVVHDDRFSTFLLKYMEKEGTPSLQPVPGVDLDHYRHQLIERFGNAAVKDTVARLCAESSDRIPKWLLPVVRENLKHDRKVTLSAAIVASWARYAEGIDEEGEPIKIVDRMADRLHATAKGNKDNIFAFLEDDEVFGEEAHDERFRTPYAAVLTSLHEIGSAGTVEKLIADEF